MENPRRGEKTRPCLNLVLEDLGLSGHEEPRVPTDLPELRVSEAVFDDTVNETQSNGVVLHFGVVEVIEQECRALFYNNGVVPAVKCGGSLKRNGAIDG